MAWATELKNLADNIKISTKDRQRTTRDLLARFGKELKEMAKDLKDLLAKSEQARMADFKTTMQGIRPKIKGIQKHVANLLGDYAEERKEAASAWAALARRHGKK